MGSGSSLLRSDGSNFSSNFKSDWIRTYKMCALLISEIHISTQHELKGWLQMRCKILIRAKSYEGIQWRWMPKLTWWSPGRFAEVYSLLYYLFGVIDAYLWVKDLSVNSGFIHSDLDSRYCFSGLDQLPLPDVPLPSSGCIEVDTPGYKTSYCVCTGGQSFFYDSNDE